MLFPIKREQGRLLSLLSRNVNWPLPEFMQIHQRRLAIGDVQINTIVSMCQQLLLAVVEVSILYLNNFLPHIGQLRK